MAAQSNFSTPINTLTREALTVLITNNVMNNSLEFASDCETMETDSPLRKPNMHPISKKLFHSPMNESTSPTSTFNRRCDKSRKAKKRKQTLLPGSEEKIKKAYVTECERNGYSENNSAGMRKKILISLFHNKEYSMDFDFDG